MTRIFHKGELNQAIYDERTGRSEAFLGSTLDEQRCSQDTLARSVVGIAGTGGIGGAMALRLARLGVRHLKIADPQTFDWTNVNRQLGASKNNIGRNKAEVVGEIVHELAGDTDIEIFNDGITVENAEEFVQGCDLILDQLEFFVLAEKYALHRAFRAHPEVKCILACSVIGWAAHLYKFEHNSMKIEDWYGIPDASSLTALSEKDFDRIINIWAPKMPRFPSYDEIRKWMKRNDAVPIFAGAPPLAEGILTQRAALALIGLERLPYATWLPPIPMMYCYDALTFEGDFVQSDGTQVNKDSLEKLWREFSRARSAAE
jgi:molybdopterin/thiamine biosynthesis adenylyltransferase